MNGKTIIMPKYNIKYTATQRVETKATRVIEARNEEEARDIFYDLIPNDGREYHADSIEALPTKRAFASGKRMNGENSIPSQEVNQAVENVLQAIFEMCDADLRNQTKDLPVVVVQLSAHELSKIVGESEK